MARVPEILLCNSIVNKQLYFSLINMINHQSQHSNAHLGFFFACLFSGIRSPR